jgi:glycosyltransferase involved in cell wall biosynthesis
VDETYFREHIAPLLKAPGVEFIGEINEQEKTEFLGQALALMFLIDWPEPFGLSMIEAMACGTPVLAFKRGAVEEVLENGITGYLVDTLEEAIAAVPRVVGLDRRTVRRQFESRFTSTRMAKDYAKVYKLLLDQMSLTAKIELIPVSRVPTQVEPVPTAPAQYAIEPNEPAI